MKALTVRQPWASLIMAGIKDVENRTWPTSYRGPLVIHAGLGLDHDAFTVHGRLLDELPRGVVLGTVELVGCVRGHPSPWAEADCWNWLVADPRPLAAPVPAKGKLGMWDVPDALLAPDHRLVHRTNPMTAQTCGQNPGLPAEDGARCQRRAVE